MTTISQIILFVYTYVVYHHGIINNYLAYQYMWHLIDQFGKFIKQNQQISIRHQSLGYGAVLFCEQKVGNNDIIVSHYVMALICFAQIT